MVIAWPPVPTWRTMDEAAKQSKVSRRTITRWVTAGLIRVYRVEGDRRRYVDLDEIRKMRQPRLIEGTGRPSGDAGQRSYASPRSTLSIALGDEQPSRIRGVVVMSLPPFFRLGAPRMVAATLSSDRIAKCEAGSRLTMPAGRYAPRSPRQEV